jgi:UDP-N-acetylglucosamine 2-epimerase (non-hydrolysing)
MKTILAIFGTRPEAIKVAPVLIELKKHTKYFQTRLVVTGQHREMLDQVLKVFGLKPDVDLNIMRPRQALSQIAGEIVPRLDGVLADLQPDLVLVQGDTSTTFFAGLASFYHKIPVGHIEAGLRTNTKYEPFPEEINRRLTSVLTDIHFAPTKTSKEFLVSEGICTENIFVTGNPVIDALSIVVSPSFQFSDPIINETLRRKKERVGRLILITMHRRENWGEPMQAVCESIRRLSMRYPDATFLFPVHRNPVVREVVLPALSGLDNVMLTDPLDYVTFVNVLNQSDLVLTDSGGIQEEAPSLGKPVLVLRDVTERPEAIRFGAAKLVGLNPDVVFRETVALMDNEEEFDRMANAINPYGDGKAAKRIVEVISYFFGFTSSRPAEFDTSVEEMNVSQPITEIDFLSRTGRGGTT